MVQIKSSHFAMGLGASIAGLTLLGLVPYFKKSPAKRDPKLQIKSGESRIMGAIPTNTPFNVLRLGLGVWGIAVSKNETAARVFLAALGGSYAAMAIMGALPSKKAQTAFGLMPIHSGNVWLHAGAAGAAVAGLAMPNHESANEGFGEALSH